MGSLVAELRPHPQSRPKNVKSLRAGIGRDFPDVLFVLFRLEGDLKRIQSLQHDMTGCRRDRLWETTCFECFVRDRGKPGYREFNFAPSGDWAAYDFIDYREGMSEAANILPYGSRETGEGWITIDKHFRIPMEREPRRTPVLEIGLSAVIEEMDGTKSYWALHHPDPDKPDFHHPDCFTLELPPPSAT